jgi:hypothetical protein
VLLQRCQSFYIKIFGFFRQFFRAIKKKKRAFWGGNNFFAAFFPFSSKKQQKKPCDRKKNKAILVLGSIGFQIPIKVTKSGFIGSIHYDQQYVNIFGEAFSKVFRK